MDMDVDVDVDGGDGGRPTVMNCARGQGDGCSVCTEGNASARAVL